MSTIEAKIGGKSVEFTENGTNSSRYFTMDVHQNKEFVIVMKNRVIKYG